MANGGPRSGEDRRTFFDQRFQVLSAEQAYAPSSYRESRDSLGRLSFEPPERRLQLLSGMPVVNVETGAHELR